MPPEPSKALPDRHERELRAEDAERDRDLLLLDRDALNDAVSRLRAENERLALAVKQWQGHATDAQEMADRLGEALTRLGVAFAELWSQGLNGVVCEPAQEKIGRHNCRSCHEAWKAGTEVLNAYDPKFANLHRGGPMFQPDFERSVESDEHLATDEDCGRLLVGQGTDTWDPMCARPRGHEGPCRPGVDGASRDSRLPEEGR